MGYTHYWKSQGFTSAQWRAIATEAHRLIHHAEERGVVLVKEYNEIESTPEVTEEFIMLNGLGEEGHETLFLTREASDFEFCKTAEKPYDETVGALLSFAQSIAPGAFETSNDGDREY